MGNRPPPISLASEGVPARALKENGENYRRNVFSRRRYEVQNLACQRDDLETARLQIEERNAAIGCLKDQLKSERRAACDKMAAQKRHHAVRTKELENKYRTIVKRHQKFIEQLLAEKTDLAQKCDSLARQIKETERKIQRDLKVIGERHAVELQRARENMAAAEKIRRERWLETKTSKIKVNVNLRRSLLAYIIQEFTFDSEITNSILENNIFQQRDPTDN